MKKRSIRTGILFALLTPVLLICAENPIYAATTQTAGSATVSYHVDPAYQVTIPVDTSMQFNETETSYGNIVVEQAQIEDGKCIQVSLLSDLLPLLSLHLCDFFPHGYYGSPARLY